MKDQWRVEAPWQQLKDEQMLREKKQLSWISNMFSREMKTNLQKGFGDRVLETGCLDWRECTMYNDVRPDYQSPFETRNGNGLISRG